MRPIAAIRARIWIAQGNLTEAADWARDRGVSATEEPAIGVSSTTSPWCGCSSRSTARTGTARPTRLPTCWTGCARREASGRAGSLLEIRMLQALVPDAQGHRPEALESLAGGSAQAPEPEGYVRLFLDEGAPMLSLLRDAKRRRRGRPGAAPARRAAPPPRPRLAPVAGRPSSAEPLSDRELQVLRLLDSELTGPEIARELFVSHNTLRTHTKHIFTKLDVTSRRAAVLRARERGLLCQRASDARSHPVSHIVG